MKKIIAVIALMFAFSINASAQDKKVSPEEAAKIDAFKLSEAIGLKGQQQDDFIMLFVMKHQTMNDPALSQERKAEMARIVEAKVRASVTPEQMAKLEANPALMATITGADQAKKKK